MGMILTDIAFDPTDDLYRTRFMSGCGITFATTLTQAISLTTSAATTPVFLDRQGLWTTFWQSFCPTSGAQPAPIPAAGAMLAGGSALIGVVARRKKA
ncbi:hypothetical protein [uncultured Paracoccus sp.]|uniref:hypothetical protein n=1 Tax=uncultured Paracoccus sp. TaxID=189685 RepID=UPI0025EC0B20|nr:hypothetical protein [uncultured Paracoccus sp.]